MENTCAITNKASLSQWLNFKLFGITYLVGKIKFKLFFSGSIGWVRSKHFTGLYASEDFSGLCQRGGKALECRSSGWSCRARWCHILLAPVRNPQKHCHDKELGCFHWRRPTKTWRISTVCLPTDSLFVCSGCHGTLLKRCEVASTLYDLAGRQEVIAVTKQCSVRSCRASYGYNYVWQNGSKMNAVSLEGLVDEVLFVSSKMFCFCPCGSPFVWQKVLTPRIQEN